MRVVTVKRDHSSESNPKATQSAAAAEPPGSSRSGVADWPLFCGVVKGQEINISVASPTHNLLKRLGWLGCIAVLFGAAEIHAQGLARPQLCPEEGACVSLGDEPYDLSAYSDQIEDVFGSSPPAWPTPPRDGSTTSIRTNNCSTLQDAVSTSGSLRGARKIELSADVTNCSVTISQDDIWIEMTNSASISGSGAFRINADRVRITGGAINTAGSSQLDIRGNDVLIENVIMVLGSSSSTSSGTGMNIAGSYTRIAVVNSSIDAYRYAIYSDGTGPDLILAGNEINGSIAGGSATTQTTARIMQKRNVIVADNRFTNARGSTGLRPWKGARDWLIAGNHFIDAQSGGMAPLWIGGVSGNCGTVNNMLVHGNKTYANRSSASAFEATMASCGSQTCGGITVTGNTPYGEPDTDNYRVTTGGGGRNGCSITNSGTLTADNDVAGNQDFSSNFPGGYPSASELGIGPDH